MRRRRPSVGTVLEFPLPNGQFVYGRCLRDGAVAFYRTRSTQPGHPPIGERDYEFVVGVYDDVVKDEQSNTVTMESLRRPVLASFRVAVPDEHAQWALVERIEARVADTAKVIEKTQREIALLQEFRSRLVADVVTGQVDVRAIAATLPDEPEPVDDLAADSSDDLADALAEADG